MQESSASMDSPILEVDNVQINYETRKGDIEAIQGVTFKVNEGETVGLVGESGCGKSTIAFGIVNFLGPNGKIVDGSIRFQGEELVGRTQQELKKLRDLMRDDGIRIYVAWPSAETYVGAVSRRWRGVAAGAYREQPPRAYGECRLN